MIHPSTLDTQTLVPLIEAWQRGDGAAGQRLFEAIHGELRAIAAALLRNERPDHTLQPTALVNELYLKLSGLQELAYENRAHFLSMAARAMRQVLVDHARGRLAEKRGASWIRTDSTAGLAAESKPIEVLALEEALCRLEGVDPQRARFVELRYYLGLTLDQTALALGLSPTTAKRQWRATRAWLRDALETGHSPEPGHDR
jgi:RNA polymerase sigma factor (TIGR02999 family)